MVLVFLFRPRAEHKSHKPEKAGQLKRVYKRVLQASLALVVLAGIIFTAGNRNNYFARLWNYWTDEESTGQYLQYIAFDQRLTYWRAAYRMYEAYPIFGVGLGNFTFYFEQFLADRALHPNPELLTKLTPEEGRSQLSTVKGVFPRLLAETGLMGVATFLSFFIALLGFAFYLTLASDREPRFWGRAGLLGMVVFLVVSFSFDSFSLPNMWVVFGFTTAAAQVFAPGCDGPESAS